MDFKPLPPIKNNDMETPPPSYRFVEGEEKRKKRRRRKYDRTDRDNSRYDKQFINDVFNCDIEFLDGMLEDINIVDIKNENMTIKECAKLAIELESDNGLSILKSLINRFNFRIIDFEKFCEIIVKSSFFQERIDIVIHIILIRYELMEFFNKIYLSLNETCRQLFIETCKNDNKFFDVYSNQIKEMRTLPEEDKLSMYNALIKINCDFHAVDYILKHEIASVLYLFIDNNFGFDNIMLISSNENINESDKIAIIRMNFENGFIPMATDNTYYLTPDNYPTLRLELVNMFLMYGIVSPNELLYNVVEYSVDSCHTERVKIIKKLLKFGANLQHITSVKKLRSILSTTGNVMLIFLINKNVFNFDNCFSALVAEPEQYIIDINKEETILKYLLECNTEYNGNYHELMREVVRIDDVDRRMVFVRTIKEHNFSKH